MPTDEEDDARIAELIAQIRRSDDPTAELLRPLSSDERGAMADQVLASLGMSAPAPERVASVIPLRPSTRSRPPPRMRALWALPLAAAFMLAALSLLLSRGGGQQLVAYRLEVAGDMKERGDEPPTSAADGPVKLRPETKLRVRLAPAEPARDVSLRLLVVRDGKATVISPPAMADGQGGFTIEEAAGKLLGAQVDGPVELVFALGRPLPEDADLVRLALDRAASPPAAVRIERRAVQLVGFSPKHGALGWSGCKGVRVGPVCEIGADTPVHVWAEGTDAARFTLRVDAREATAAPLAVEGGLRWTVTPPAGARLVTLALAGREVLRLPLAPAAEAPLVVEAEALRRQGKLDEAEVRLDRAEQDPAARIAAMRLRAKIARRRGDSVRAASLREEVIVADRASGRVSNEVDDQTARVFDLIYQDGALAEARRRLDAIPPPDEGDAEDRVMLDYYRGLVAAEVGDLRGAIKALRAARIGARRFALPTFEVAVAAPLADLLSELGRHDEAAALLAEIEQSLAATVDRCERAAHVMNHGAVLLRAGRTAEASPRLAEATRIAGDGCPRLTGNLLTNLAFLHRDDGAVAEARAVLARARAAPRGPRMGLWQDRLAIELALDGDARSALAAAERVRREGEASLSPELIFDAELGRARALDQLGDTVAAGHAYASAEQALDAWGSLVPLGEGRQAFLERQERAPRAWLDFLRREAARGNGGAAASVTLARAARRSVARFYRVLGEADRAGALAAGADDGYATAIAAYRVARARINASLAGGEPPSAGDLQALRDRQTSAAPPLAAVDREPAAPREGELSLVYHPLPDGWLGIAWTAAGVVTRPLGRIDPAARAPALATALLEPFRDLVTRATSIHVHAHHALSAVAFHALPWDGGALLDRAPVLYGVDLPAPTASAGTIPGTCTGVPAALVVADARENLAGAGAAAGLVEAALRARGYAVRLLRGEAARLDAVREALADPCVELFHYEGHAVFEGRDGVDASLLLADGRLSAAEILRLPRVPETAVLSGCSTGEAEGLGLAQAFLARGAVEVLATSAPVEDATAALVARRLYEPPSPAPSRGSRGHPPRLAHLADTWRAAVAHLRRDGARPADLDAYRVLQR